MAIGDDFSVSASGNIRYTGSTANYTVIAFHRWLGDLMDDAQASGNDVLDITDATASERSTDNIITLKAPYNIDEVAAQHLYDGSIIQDNGDTIYDGVVVFANAGAFLYILQNGNVVAPNFWTTGLNADAAAGISHRFMLKVRSAAADIDGRRIVGITREFGSTYSEFKATTARGNNVLALTYASDLNNLTSAATVKGWTSITNTEGYRLLDVDNNGLSENYYSEWNRDTFTINQLYERTKWLARRSTEEAQNTADTGTNYAVGDGTITGQAQSFANGVVASYVTRVRARMKKVGSPTGNLVARIYASDAASPQAPTGAALATSVNLNVAQLTTSYQEVEIGFTTQFKMTASTNYFVAFEYTGGDGSNFVHVEGAAAGTYASQNRAQKNGVWVGNAASDLWFKAFSSPELYEISGERFRGITHEIVVDTLTGTFQTVEPISWSGGTGQMLAQVFVDTGATTLSVNGGLQFTRAAGSFIADGFRPGMTIVTIGFTNGGNNATKVISSLTATAITVTDTTGLVTESGTGDERMRAGHMWMQLLTGVAPTDNQTITGGQSAATALVNVTVTERTVSPTFVGASTGSALIGGYGVGVETVDLSASDKLFDLTNTQRTPPNNVTFTVLGLVSGEDRVLVGPAQIGALDEDQLTLSVSLSGATETAVVVTTAIPSDTPSSGTIRVQLNSGIYRRLTYTSFSGSTFTIPSTDFTSDPATAPKNVFISYIDKLAAATSESFTVVYSADRSLFVRVRDGGGTPIKTFETTGTLGSAGGSATAIRTSDA